MVRDVFVFIFFFLCYSLSAQFSIHGKITGKDGEPLTGAYVLIENSATGVITDSKGYFEIKKLSAGSYNLSVSYIGYNTLKSSINLNSDYECNLSLAESAILADEVIVLATRANNSAQANSIVNYQTIEKNNLGQDVPFLIGLSPSVTTTSDAGAGVGYTGFRIRGTDANRINITVNGIPMNDAESHGVWWVNMPDFASSVENIQIQRGVGTSTNGAAAFGATINMQTNAVNNNAYSEISSAAGSFNTFKNTVKMGSGLIKDHFAFDARLSKINSDGFVDRASSDLKSFYFSGGYFSKNTLLKAVIFSGKEKTYQSWNGVPKVRLENDTAGMIRYEQHGLYTPEETQHMLESNSRTYNYYTYSNETDNYQQDHYQFFVSQSIGNLILNAALHFTHGKGYYEEFRNNEDLADYLLNNIIIGGDTITSTDLVRQKWLDNNFYGTTFSLNYNTNKVNTTIGGAWNKYDGQHFGNIIWGQYLGDTPQDYEWYGSTGVKTDFDLYSKTSLEIGTSANFFLDLQYRQISHKIKGVDDDQRDITQVHTYGFFNPKIGVTLQPGLNQTVNFFYAIGHREPNRSNFTDAKPDGPQPLPEALQDFELGYTYASYRISAGANMYCMLYRNQLVVTGEINDVGSAVMVNVDNSFRTGIELFATAKISKNLSWNLNTTLSRNKILNFTEYVDNWDTWNQDSIYLGTTNLAFSPEIIVNSEINYNLFKNFDISLISQFVGKQYIDNTSSPDRMLDPYFVNNIRFNYWFETKFIKVIEFQLMINNILNQEYESNAWVYSYLLGGTRYEMDGYFPQAGINFLGGITIKF
jgi:iron complex outermembrane receptor protein